MKLEVFNNKTFGAVRVLADERGEPWFVAKDVCDILGYANSREAVAKLDEDERGVSEILTSSGVQKMTIINESGLYNLILRSNKPKAKKFRKWVTNEVLPAIRKYGLYATDEVIEKTLNNPDFMIKLLEELKKERKEKAKLQEKITLLTHTKKTYTTTEIAKELGFRSARELNKKLEEMKIQYKVNDTWVLNAKYADKGYESIKQISLINGNVVYDRRWTQKGREFLLELFKNYTTSPA